MNQPLPVRRAGWMALMRDELADALIELRLLGVGGAANATREDYAAVEAALAMQMAYLGALKGLLYQPVFGAFGVSAAVVRLPSQSLNACTTSCRSASSTVIVEPGRTTDTLLRSAPPRTVAGMSRNVRRSARVSTTICSTQLRSSRTLPGQSYAINTLIASPVISRTFLLFSRLNSSRNPFTNSGMSSRRSRNGGMVTVITLSR